MVAIPASGRFEMNRSLNTTTLPPTHSSNRSDMSASIQLTAALRAATPVAVAESRVLSGSILVVDLIPVITSVLLLVIIILISVLVT